ncbi:MAG: hypothetical protein KDK91_04775 [Gammaproteobacteria bacterium]|nr:hypothetical protein [Gammaproteobacteria bacterium]
MSLDKYFKRYVYDEEKTPYATPVRRLSRRQADYEVYAYTLFIGILFAAVALVAVTGKLPQGKLMGVGLYAFSVVCAALIFGFLKHHLAALYCALTPISAVLYYLTWGFPPNLGGLDQALIMIFVLLWARYSWRVLQLGRFYPHMSERVVERDDAGPPSSG